ncbi:MAG TPA: hypothetical protein VL625_04385 [Patescibacteria group bacterium]|nr:hypothetical protein [Patescibacteria group bacterium]
MTVLYRGVDREAVTDSLHRAVDFIQACHLGPASDKLVGSVMEICKPFEMLPTASDDRTMAAIMNASRASYMVGRFHDLFAHHARAERSEGKTDGPAQQLYRDLCAWDAFYGMKPGEEIAGEITDHVIVDCLALVEKQEGGLGSERAHHRIKKAFKDYRETAEWLERIVPILQIMDTKEGREDIVNFIRGEDVWDKAVLQKALYDITGYGRADAALEVPHAFRRYAIIPPSAQDVPVTMEEKLAEFLEPYTATHEVDLRSVRIFGDSFSNLGVNFTATPRVAAEVADAFKQYAGYKLIDYDAAIVEPRPVSPAASPQPPFV